MLNFNPFSLNQHAAAAPPSPSKPRTSSTTTPSHLNSTPLASPSNTLPSFFGRQNASTISQDFSPGESCQSNNHEADKENHSDLVALNKVSQIFKKIFQLNDRVATLVTNNIFKRISQLKENQMIDIDASELLPSMILTKNSIIIPLQFLNKGTFSKVYKAIFIPTQSSTLNISSSNIEPTDLSPSKPKTVALKIGAGYQHEQETLRKATQGNLTALDYSFITARSVTNSKLECSVNELYHYTLLETPFHEMAHPVANILKALRKCTKGLNFHQNQFVHRDIKGANILVKVEEDKSQNSTPGKIFVKIRSAALTDFGFLREEKLGSHFTASTPNYIDPCMFSRTTCNLLNQKKRVGRQDTYGDIYALGFTIIYDVIANFLLKKSEGLSSNKKIVEYISFIKGKREIKSFSTQELVDKAQSLEFRTVYLGADHSKQDIITTYPSLKLILEALSSAFDSLKGTLTEEEIAILNKLSALACSMQTPEKSERPSISMILSSLKTLSQELNPNSRKRQKAQHENLPPAKKLKIHLEDAPLEPFFKTSRNNLHKGFLCQSETETESDIGSETVLDPLFTMPQENPKSLFVRGQTPPRESDCTPRASEYSLEEPTKTQPKDIIEQMIEAATQLMTPNSNEPHTTSPIEFFPGAYFIRTPRESEGPPTQLMNSSES